MGKGSKFALERKKPATDLVHDMLAKCVRACWGQGVCMCVCVCLCV